MAPQILPPAPRAVACESATLAQVAAASQCIPYIAIELPRGAGGMRYAAFLYSTCHWLCQ